MAGSGIGAARLWIGAVAAAAFATALMAAAAGPGFAAEERNCAGDARALGSQTLGVDFSCDFDNPSGSFAVILNRPVSGYDGFPGYTCGVPVGDSEAERAAYETTLQCSIVLDGRPAPGERRDARKIPAHTDLSGTIDTVQGWDCAEHPLTVTIEYRHHEPSESGDPFEDLSVPGHYPIMGPCGKQLLAGNAGVTAPPRQTAKSLGVSVQCFTGCQLKAVAKLKLPKQLRAAAKRRLVIEGSESLPDRGEAFIPLKPRGKQAKLLKRALRRTTKLMGTIRVTSSDNAGKTGSAVRKITVHRS